MAGLLEQLGNEGPIDRVTRGILGVVLAILGFLERAHFAWAVVLYVLAAVLVLTALTGV